MIGKRGRQVVAIAIQPDERFRRAQVQLAACAGQQAVVRDVLRQRVLEDDCGFVGARFLVQKLEPTEFPQFQRILAAAPHSVQELERYFTTEHGGGLQDVLRSFRQPIDPRHNHALHRLRNGCRVRSALNDGTCELLEEERVALALLDNGRRGRFG